MTLPKLNPLALFACSVGAWSVWENRQHVAETNWLIAALVGAFVAIAWLRDKKIGAWLCLASAVLFVCALPVQGQVSEASRVIAAGSSAGILTVMSIAFVLKTFINQ